MSKSTWLDSPYNRSLLDWLKKDLPGGVPGFEPGPIPGGYDQGYVAPLGEYIGYYRNTPGDDTYPYLEVDFGAGPTDLVTTWVAAEDDGPDQQNYRSAALGTNAARQDSEPPYRANTTIVTSRTDGGSAVFSEIKADGPDSEPGFTQTATIATHLGVNGTTGTVDVAASAKDEVAVRLDAAKTSLVLNGAEGAIYMRSPNGNSYKLAVANNGTLSITPA